ncbi:MAG: DNA-protecting protein DprA [Limnochordaceae bacterium]|nr:DNA-protecting protein DprA [Limnochordaceae bacterium]
MQPQERLCWIQWNQIPQIGARRIGRLLQVFGSLAAAWQAPLGELAEVLGEQLAAHVCRLRSRCHGDDQLERAERMGVEILTWQDPEYPLLLREIADPPPVLYRAGVPAPEDVLAVAVVGTRRASEAGRRLAGQIAAGLVERGVVVVSGLALGIDGHAHAAALKAGGRSLAVLGCGLDLFYPPEHAQLQQELARHGCLYSPYPLGTPPYGPNFIARNRIISGLAWGTVVVEAGSKSGAMVTAAFACQQNRDVCAVPGDPGRIGSQGCNRLIREGAAAVTSAEEVIQELNLARLFRWHGSPAVRAARRQQAGSREGGAARPALPAPPPPDLPGVSPQVAQAVYEALIEQELTFDQLLSRCGAAGGGLRRALVEMELRGVVIRVEGGRYRWA